MGKGKNVEVQVCFPNFDVCNSIFSVDIVN